MVAQHLDGFDLLNIELPRPATNLIILLITKCVTILDATLDVLANSVQHFLSLGSLFTCRLRLAAQRYTRKALLDLAPQTARPSQDSEDVSIRTHCLRTLC